MENRMDCFYINLDSAAERKTNFEKNFNALKKQDWNLSRFSAVDTEFVKNNNVPGESRPGEKGCFLSHKTIIGSNLAHDRPIFILEDDAVLGARTGGLIDGMLQSKTQDWDNFLKSVLNPKILELHRLMVSIGKTFPAVGSFFYESGPNTAYAIVANWIEKQQAAGKLAGGNPRQLAVLFLDMLIGEHQLALLTSPRQSSPKAIEKTVRSAIALFLNGAKPRSPSHKSDR